MTSADRIERRQERALKAGAEADAREEGLNGN